MESSSLDLQSFVHPTIDLVPLPNEYVPEEDDIDPALRATSEAPQPVETDIPLAEVVTTEDGPLTEDQPHHQDANEDGPVGGADREDEAQDDESEEHPDPALKQILASLRASSQAMDVQAGAVPEEEEEERQRELSSPLSSVPDLPTELYLPSDPEPVKAPPVESTNPPAPPLFVDIRKIANASGTLFNAEAGPSRSPRAEPSGPTTLADIESSNGVHPAKSSSPKAPKSPLVDLTPAKRKRTEGQEPNYAPAELSDEEFAAKPKTKRKAKPKVAQGDDEDSKGGKRKRGEDGKAPRSGKSRKMLDHALGMDRDSAEHPEKIAPRTKIYTDAQIRSMLKGKETETQMSLCLRDRYTKWGKCTQCIGKQGGDTCRFRDFRTFKIDPETIEILGPGYFESKEWTETMTPLPKVFNSPMKQEHVERIEKTVAPLLLPLISRELRHLIKNKAIKRGMDAARHRAVCDFCASTIFAGWWFCKRCGRDICLVCERYFSDSLETMSLSPWHLPDAARPRLLKCNDLPGSRKPQFHFRPDLQPVSRFSEEELQEHWLALADFVLEGGGDDGVGERLEALGLSKAGEEAVEAVQEWTTLRLPMTQKGIQPAMSDDEVQALYTKSTHTASPPPDPAQLEEQSMAFMKIDDDKLSNPIFDLLWGRGEPMVVDKVGDKLKMSWTPESFVERFGPQRAVVVNCQTGDNSLMSIQSYFNKFNDRENRSKAILKLKDWPETGDFAEAVPELYNDFCDALPVPDYTRREGVLNLYANFPPGPTRPDIGPKMYNAFEAIEDVGGKGSTSLHMDVADAINVMLYASPRLDGQPGCAVWDLFRAEDADKIRLFLKGKYDDSHIFTDPIHSQLFYLHSGLRKELWEKYGVASWRIYQYPGQAVFIPAGCAHQVCNLADCIKIAVDFVSPHNVGRCQQLTQAFRTENFVKAWKEDVLQLYNVLWYAWTNTREIKAQWASEAQAEAQKQQDRARHLAALANGEHPTDQDPHPGVQRSLSGFIGHQISSARDEGVNVAGDVEMIADSAGPSGSRMEGIEEAQATRAPEDMTKDVSGPAAENDLDKSLPPPSPPHPEPSPSDPLQSRRRAIAQRLMAATLSLAEPPPPPEARNPSKATNWVLSAKGKVGRPNFNKPKPKVVRKKAPKASVGAERSDDMPVVEGEMKENGENGAGLIEASGEPFVKAPAEPMEVDPHFQATGPTETTSDSDATRVARAAGQVGVGIGDAAVNGVVSSGDTDGSSRVHGVILVDQDMEPPQDGAVPTEGLPLVNGAV